jgi:hypothetical protein
MIITMKPSLKLLTLFAFAAILSLTYCKDEDPTPVVETRTKTELITLSDWKITSMMCDTSVDTDGKDGASKDLLIQRLACQNDNSYKFNTDSTTTEYTNVKCNANEKASYKGTWMFTNSEKNLLWNGENYPVQEISASKMIVRYTIKASGNVYGITITFTH